MSDGCAANWGLGFGTTINWFDGAVAAEGSGGVTAAIKSTPGAIGYLEAGHGYGESLAEIPLRNAAGEYVGCWLCTSAATGGGAATAALAQARRWVGGREGGGA